MLRLTALVLAAHLSSRGSPNTGMAVPARLCGHSPHQTGELLDRLVAQGTLAPGTGTRRPMRWSGNCPHSALSPGLPFCETGRRITEDGSQTCPNGTSSSGYPYYPYDRALRTGRCCRPQASATGQTHMCGRPFNSGPRSRKGCAPHV